MSEQRLRVLVLSDLFPAPSRPAYGIFVERQTTHVQRYCDHTVVVPTRIFPHLRIWRELARPAQVRGAWRDWRKEIREIPLQSDIYGYPVYYPRYTAPPHQLSHASWGFCAYPALVGLVRRLHIAQPFDLIHAHYGTPAGVVALLARRWMRVPVVISVHGMDVTYTAPQNRFGAAVTRWVFQQADALIANSNWTREKMYRIAERELSVDLIYYGGQAPSAPAIEANRADRNDKVIRLLSVGYIEERKGHQFVLRAMRRLIDQGCRLHYTIVGDGSRLEELEAEVDRLGLADVVEFAGLKRHDEVWPYFADCDIFVLPSWDEAFGIVYVEALGMGKPVIGCAGEGGPEDLARFGDCVELVKPRDVASLAQGLERLITDPDRRREMGERGRTIVVNISPGSGMLRIPSCVTETYWPRLHMRPQAFLQYEPDYDQHAIDL
ncbi:MAG: glycosyltransferase family 4 protein [Oscillochloris sp.]|nr:glycosyltransferase family 4 protein [Oscillochloris sp.]